MTKCSHSAREEETNCCCIRIAVKPRNEQCIHLSFSPQRILQGEGEGSVAWGLPKIASSAANGRRFARLWITQSGASLYGKCSGYIDWITQAEELAELEAEDQQNAIKVCCCVVQCSLTSPSTLCRWTWARPSRTTSWRGCWSLPCCLCSRWSMVGVSIYSPHVSALFMQTLFSPASVCCLVLFKTMKAGPDFYPLPIILFSRPLYLPQHIWGNVVNI